MQSVIKRLCRFESVHRIEGIYDPSDVSFHECSKIIGSPIKRYGCEVDLITEKDIDWIFIGSPNNLHKNQIIGAIRAGKNIFSEKPLAISLRELREIKEEYEKGSSELFISYPLRYSLHYTRIKEYIDRGYLGDIVSFECNETLPLNHGSFIHSDWRRVTEVSGGHLLEKCCHDLDICNWIIGDIPRKCASFGGLNFFTERNKSFFNKMVANNEKFPSQFKWLDNPFTTKKDIVDNQIAILEYGNGARATFHTNCATGLPERRLYICGTEGTLRADVLTGKIEIKSLIPLEKDVDFLDEKTKGDHGNGDHYLVEELNKVMNGEKRPRVSVHDAIRSAATALVIDQARKENRVINLEPIWERFDYKSKPI